MTEHDQQDPKPGWFKRNIIRPSTAFEHDAVSHVQRVLNVPTISGEMDEDTISSIRGLQQLFNLNVTGYLNEETAVQIERLRNRYTV
jgi:hypothetical protein